MLILLSLDAFATRAPHVRDFLNFSRLAISEQGLDA